MELQQAITNRRSIRRYKDLDVENEKLVQLIESALLAPSWKNQQTSRYYIVKEKDTLKKLKSYLPDFNQENSKDAPVLIVTTFVKDNVGFYKEGNPCDELGNGWGCYDCGLQHMNLLLKAEELGLGSLIMGLRDVKSIRTLLNIPDNELMMSIIAIGYPDINPDMPKRKSVEEIAKIFD